MQCLNGECGDESGYQYWEVCMFCIFNWPLYCICFPYLFCCWTMSLNDLTSLSLRGGVLGFEVIFYHAATKSRIHLLLKPERETQMCHHSSSETPLLHSSLRSCLKTWPARSETKNGCIEVYASCVKAAFSLLTTRAGGHSSGCIEVYALRVEAALSLLTTRGRLLWLYRNLCFKC